MTPELTNKESWKEKTYEIIFKSDTPAGKAFDVALIISILFSSIVVLLDSIKAFHLAYGSVFFAIELFFTIIFTIEYILRIYCVENKLRYIRSFFGVIDLLTILPALISILFPSAQFLMVIRILRLLRLFRIFKMVRYVQESRILKKALLASRPKITIFIFTILFVVTIVGAVMYIVEGESNGFNSIPESMYWAIITITTVGFGDITPQTAAGKFIASFLMIIAYGIIAVPTGIFSYELARVAKSSEPESRKCPHCSAEGHTKDAQYCYRCGGSLSTNG